MGKLLKLHRRPLPLEVKNIGIWEDIFQILSKIGCVTNVALCFFVVDISPIFLNAKYAEDGRRDYQAVKMKLGLFIAFSVGFLLLTTVIEQLFTPVSTAVRVQRAPVWKSNFGRPTPSTRSCLRNLTHWLISTRR